MSMDVLYPLAAEHLHRVNRDELKQTLAESKTATPEQVGRFLVHYGFRDCLPIIIVELIGEDPDEVSLVWYDESITGRSQ